LLQINDSLAHHDKENPMNQAPKDYINEKFEVQEKDKTAVFKPPSPGRGTPPFPKNVFFVGLSHSGKTTLGKLVAEELDKKFVHTRALVEAEAGMGTLEIVKAKGWEEFDRLESEALERVCGEKDQIVATSARVVLADKNRELLKENGRVFYLMADVPLVFKRLVAETDPARRPVLADQAPKDLKEEVVRDFVEREPLYMELGGTILQAGKEPAELVQDVRITLRIR